MSSCLLHADLPMSLSRYNTNKLTSCPQTKLSMLILHCFRPDVALMVTNDHSWCWNGCPASVSQMIYCYVSVLSSGSYAALWNSCSAPQTSGVYKFLVQPCNWRVVPINTVATSLKEHFAETIPPALPRSFGSNAAYPVGFFVRF